MTVASTLPVTLILPCFNRLEQTNNLLNSLSDCVFNAEIIIVDDCSTDSYATLLSKYSELNIQYIKNPTNMGPAYCRNKGVELAKNDLIAFTDNDCIITKDWLPKLYNTISGSSSKVAGVGGRVLPKGRDLVSYYYTYHKILDPWFYKGRYYYLVTANAIFRKSAIIEVGGFDSSLRQAGGEDPGLCFKLMKKGYFFGYNPEAVVIHDYDTSILGIFHAFYRYGYGCSRQMKKHHETPIAVQRTNFGGMVMEDE